MADEFCDGLWRARNAVFARNGYCFESADAQAVFGKGCFPPFGKLSPAEDAIVQRIKDLERSNNCSVKTAAPAAAPADAITLPKYIVEVTLSPNAAEKLSSSGETVRVWASYYGEAAPGVQGDEMDQVQLATETTDILTGHAVNLGGLTVAGKDVAKIVDRRPMLLINVYTSRKVFKDNLLDCGIYQDEAAKAAVVDIKCKLIGEYRPSGQRAARACLSRQSGSTKATRLPKREKARVRLCQAAVEFWVRLSLR